MCRACQWIERTCATFVEVLSASRVPRPCVRLGVVGRTSISPRVPRPSESSRVVVFFERDVPQSFLASRAIPCPATRLRVSALCVARLWLCTGVGWLPTGKHQRPHCPLLFNREAVELSRGRSQRSRTSRTTHQSSMLDLRGSCIHLSRAALVPSLLPAFRREAADAFSPVWSEAQPRVTHPPTPARPPWIVRPPALPRVSAISAPLTPRLLPLTSLPFCPNPCLSIPSALFLKYFQKPYLAH